MSRPPYGYPTQLQTAEGWRPLCQMCGRPLSKSEPIHETTLPFGPLGPATVHQGSCPGAPLTEAEVAALRTEKA